MKYFRRYLKKCVRYFNFLPDHLACFSFFALLSELIYLPHLAQYIFPAVRHLVKFLYIIDFDTPLDLPLQVVKFNEQNHSITFLTETRGVARISQRYEGKSSLVKNE